MRRALIRSEMNSSLQQDLGKLSAYMIESFRSERSALRSWSWARKVRARDDSGSGIGTREWLSGLSELLRLGLRLELLLRLRLRWRLETVYI